MLKKPSQLVLLLSFAAILWYQSIGHTEGTLSWDAFGYYIYLPTKFIYEGSGLDYGDWLQKIMDQYEPSSTFYQVYQTETGKWMSRYTMGMAVLESPFFFIAHLLAPVLG